MNKQKKNFWLDIILLALFVLSVVSLADEDNRAWIMAHYVTGALMILGSVVHVMWHWDWIKVHILRCPQDMGKTNRANRRIDIPLLALFALCGVSGLLVWLMELTALNHVVLLLRHWASLHRLSGTFMFVFMLPHLGYHWKWLVCMTRKCFASGKQVKLTLDS